MAVRIGFDMDGVLADFSSAFREVEMRLFGPSSSVNVQPPDVEAAQDRMILAARGLEEKGEITLVEEEANAVVS